VAKPTRSSDLTLRLDHCTPPLILDPGFRRKCLPNFYIHGSVHRESNLITVQQDATYTVY